MKRYTETLLLVVLACALSALAQQSTVRVYVADRDEWESSSVAYTHAEVNRDSGSLNSGARSQSGIRRVNTEQVKNLNKACPSVTITGDPSKADYFIVWDVKTWQQTSWAGHQNEYTVYQKDGDLLGSGDAHTISGAAKGICKALGK